MSGKENKIKYNLKNVHVAKLTENPEGTFTYDTPKPIPGAVSISFEPQGESSPFHADGIVYYRSVSNNGYSGDLEIARTPDWFYQDILKEELDEKGVMTEKSTKVETVPFALLFEFDGDVNATKHVFYNCSAARPTLTGKTTEGTITPETEKLTLTADPRKDGLVKARTGATTDETTYANWYKSVYVAATEEM